MTIEEKRRKAKIYYNKNRDIIRKRVNKYKAEHPEKRLEYVKKNKKEMKRKAKIYYNKNRDMIIEKTTVWRKTNIDRIRKSKQKNGKIIKNQVFMHYSNGVIQCNCCGELEIEFLQLDHINGRKQHGHGFGFGGESLYRWIIHNDYPNGFQVLCSNCNWGKYRNGICPHQLKKNLGITKSIIEIN